MSRRGLSTPPAPPSSTTMPGRPPSEPLGLLCHLTLHLAGMSLVIILVLPYCFRASHLSTSSAIIVYTCMENPLSTREKCPCLVLQQCVGGVLLGNSRCHWAIQTVEGHTQSQNIETKSAADRARRRRCMPQAHQKDSKKVPIGSAACL